MADAVKFTKDEMKQIKNLQDIYANLQNNLGQMGVSRIRLEQQIKDLSDAEVKVKQQFADTQQKERDFVQSINKKYGDGNLDLNTGVFTPNVSEEDTKKTL